VRCWGRRTEELIVPSLWDLRPTDRSGQRPGSSSAPVHAQAGAFIWGQSPTTTPGLTSTPVAVVALPALEVVLYAASAVLERTTARTVDGCHLRPPWAVEMAAMRLRRNVDEMTTLWTFWDVTQTTLIRENAYGGSLKWSQEGPQKSMLVSRSRCSDGCDQPRSRIWWRATRPVPPSTNWQHSSRSTERQCHRSLRDDVSPAATVPCHPLKSTERKSSTSQGSRWPMLRGRLGVKPTRSDLPS
jgi:hypothetical protein